MTLIGNSLQEHTVNLFRWALIFEIVVKYSMVIILPDGQNRAAAEQSAGNITRYVRKSLWFSMAHRRLAPTCSALRRISPSWRGGTCLGHCLETGLTRLGSSPKVSSQTSARFVINRNVERSQQQIAPTVSALGNIGKLRGYSDTFPAPSRKPELHASAHWRVI